MTAALLAAAFVIGFFVGGVVGVKAAFWKMNTLVATPGHPDRLTVNGVVYGLSPATAAGLFSCYQNLKRKRGAS